MRYLFNWCYAMEYTDTSACMKCNLFIVHKTSWGSYRDDFSVVLNLKRFGASDEAQKDCDSTNVAWTKSHLIRILPSRPSISDQAHQTFFTWLMVLKPPSSHLVPSRCRRLCLHRASSHRLPLSESRNHSC